MALLSPGTSILEIDASAIVPTVSNSVAVFAGYFTKGPTNTYSLITNEDDLVQIYGKPTNANYNDWYQARTFLNYGNSLLVARVTSEDYNNAEIEIQSSTSIGFPTVPAEYLFSNIGNLDEFEIAEPSIAFYGASSKLKFMSRNPGYWGNNIEIAIATPELFASNTTTYMFPGIELKSLFEYPAVEANEFAIAIKIDGEIVETYLVSTDPTAKDFNNKSMYVETVINNNSSYVFVKDNTAVTDPIGIHVDTVGIDVFNFGVVSLANGYDEIPALGDYSNAYNLWNNKEEVDIDIVIASENAPVAATDLVTTRQDCIAFVGANYTDIVGKSSVTAVANLLTWRSTTLTDNMFVVAVANYIYIYDKYSDKNRWVNIAGSAAGLRAQTNTNRASWFASAGLDRGKLKNVLKLAFNPDVAKRDILYKNGLNPVVAFPGTGAVFWGQKTLQSKASSFDRVNTRGLFFFKQYK